MRKIYGYELRRLVFHKFFLGILAVSLFYGWQVLSGETIRGVAHTAPFSPWSFGCFLGRTVPVICVGELFFLTFYVSKAERRASAITNASPAPEAGRALARCGAALTATALLLLAVLGLGLAWCLALFRQASLEQLLAAALCALVPPVLFCLGAGWCGGGAFHGVHARHGRFFWHWFFLPVPSHAGRAGPGLPAFPGLCRRADAVQRRRASASGDFSENQKKKGRGLTALGAPLP